MIIHRSLFWLLTVFVVLSVSSVMAQAQSDGINRMKIGLSLTPVGVQKVGPLKALDGGGSYESERLFGVDATLLYMFSEKLSLETGLGFSRQNVTRTGAVVDLGEPRRESKSTLKIWELPVLARYNFSRYFYMNGGAILHLDGSKKNSVLNKQNGIGFQVGLGADIAVNKRFSVYVNPLIKLYSAISSQNRHYSDRVLLTGLKIGVFYTVN